MSIVNERKRYVSYSGSESKRQVITRGVLHSLMSGLLFFVIQNNDLCVCTSAMPVLFTADTNLFPSGLDGAGLQDEVKWINCHWI